MMNNSKKTRDGKAHKKRKELLGELGVLGERNI
jgi:hypothetical protein